MHISLSTAYIFVSNILPLKLTPYAQKIFEITIMAFDSASQLLIIYSAFVKNLKKNVSTVKELISCS